MKESVVSILPFRPYIYSDKSTDIKDVVCPPYDIIDEKLQDALYKRSDVNVIRLEFGKELAGDNEADNRYSRANIFFKDWIAKGVLKLETEASIYIYVQKFEVDKIIYERLGFISLFSLNTDDSEGKKGIYGHEMTLSKPKEDRFKLMEATKANFSPIFSIFEDNGMNVLTVLKNSIKDGYAGKIFDFKDDNGITNILYRVSDNGVIKSVQKEMAGKVFYIADGHHRFETCVNFRDYVEKKGLKGLNADACMMYFAPANQDGLVILPTHRCIVNKKIDIDAFINEIKEDFDVRDAGRDELSAETRKSGGDGHSFGFAHKSGRSFIFSLKKEKEKDENTGAGVKNPLESLDVSILENYILKKRLKISQEDINNQKYLVYEKNAENGLTKLENGSIEAIFLMNPTEIEDVINIASLNLRMPQKSTFFYPKIITGLTINSLADISNE